MFLALYIPITLSIFILLILNKKIYRISTGIAILFFIIIGGIMAQSSISSMKYQEKFSCFRSQDFCKYETNTLSEENLKEEKTFSLSSISHLSYDVRKQTRTRKGRSRTYFIYLNTIHFKDKNNINYPISAQNYEDMKKIHDNFSSFLNSNAPTYEDKKENDNIFFAFLCLIFMFILCCIAFFKQDEK